jgi:hypothetical protein
MEYYYLINWTQSMGTELLDSGRYFYKGSGNPDHVKESIRTDLDKSANGVIHIVSKEPISKDTYEELSKGV